jgi:Tfp pilus assembly protein PilW
MPRTMHGGGRTSRPRAQRSGLTFVELLVATLLMTGVGAVLIDSFRIQMRHRADAEVTAETYQGLVAALDSLTRDVRLAGACLPTQPLFLPLSGTHDGMTDSITVRTGAAGATSGCAVAALMGPLGAGETELAVDDVSGFQVDGLAYVAGAVRGEIFRVTAVSAPSGAGVIRTDTALAQSYPVGGGVYALEERTYAVDTSSYEQPVLTRSVNRQAAQPLARGIESLRIRYRLNENCPTCTVVDLPSDDPTWVQVNEILVSATAVSRQTLSTGERLRESATVTVEPLNLETLRPS